VNINSVNVSSDCIPGSYNKSIAMNATTASRSNISYVLNDSVTNSTGILQNLSNGNYHIRVKTSAGCFADTIVAIKDAVPIACNIDIMNDTCNSGSGSILVKQTSDYRSLTYSLNNGQFQPDSFFNRLFKGVYLLNIHDGNNCRIDTTVEVNNINLNTPVSAIDVLPEVCDNNRGQINIHFAGDIVVTGVSLNNAPFQTSGLFTGLKAGQYHIAISASKCRFDTIVSVPSFVPSKPKLEISTSSPDCFDKLNGSIQIRNENNPFTISLNNSAFTDKYFYSNLVPGSYTISIKDRNSCIWDTAVTVPAFTIHKPAVNSIIKNPQCWQSLPGKIIINISGEESPYTFSVNGNTYNSGSEVSGLLPADYPVKILNRNDCVIDSLIIPLKQDNHANYNCDTAYVSTAFTPNHDGKNDILTPVIPGFFVQAITFNIYNRFGQLIFSTHKLNDGWNGTYKGRPQSAGTYVWVLQYSINNVSKIFRGATTLIR